MRKIAVLLIGALMLVIAGCGNSDKASADGAKKDMGKQQITISAAASLQEALTEIKDNFIKENQLKAEQIAINFGGSGTLSQQIEQGAPAALFISASEKNMKTLEEKHLVSAVKPFVTNTLVLIVPQGKKTYTFDTLQDVKRLSIGTPEAVPAGAYAKEVLTHMKLWDGLQDKIVYAKDVRAVLAQVSQGAVDAGMVYKTDAMQAKNAVSIMAIAPADSHKAIIYPVGLVTKNSNDLAKAFYAYLFKPESQKILEAHGFTPAK